MDDVMTPEQISEIDKDADSYHVSLIRKFSKELMGGNCTFADDDLHILICLAHRALKAGLTDDLPESVLKYLAQTHTQSRETS